MQEKILEATDIIYFIVTHKIRKSIQMLPETLRESMYESASCGSEKILTKRPNNDKGRYVIYRISKGNTNRIFCIKMLFLLPLNTILILVRNYFGTNLFIKICNSFAICSLNSTKDLCFLNELIH